MRPFRASDLDALAAIWADPVVTRFLPSCGVPIPKKSTRKSLASFIDHWEMRGYGIWGIVLISYGFHMNDLERIVAMTMSDNQAAKRVMEKAGLQYEKQMHMFNLDVLDYSIIRCAT